jgi:uncharacterized protein (TIGR02266 family)
MLDDRRSARRAMLSGVGVTVENATGERLEADVLDLSRGGIFVRTEARIAVGKRLSLEIQVTGEESPWPALGRVVWIRTAGEGLDRPAGLGVRLIDIDDTVTKAIDRLVETREMTRRGPGENFAGGLDSRAGPGENFAGGLDSRAGPAENFAGGLDSRAGPAENFAGGLERTIFGVGEPSPLGVPGIPPISIDEPESPLGAGAESPEGAAEGREASVAINLVAKRPAPGHRAPDVWNATADLPIVIPKRRRGWVVLLFLLATSVAAAAYTFRDRLPEAWSRSATFVDRILHP